MIKLLLLGASLFALWPFDFKKSSEGFLGADDSEFHQWMARHSRSYRSQQEYEVKRKVFLENLKEIEALNRQHEGEAVFGLNKFADLTLAEFSALLNPVPKKRT